MIRVGFLLGAGASFPFGIPMMREFYDRFIEYISISRSHCMPLIEKVVGSESTNRDLEYLIQRLEQVRAIRQGLEVLHENQDGVRAHLALADELRGYLEMFLIETCEKFDQLKVDNKLTKLVALAHERSAHIFTTNYDRLIEVAAAKIGVICSDGFEPPSSHPESGWTGEFSEGIRLLKLHGSVNWYEEEGSDSLVRLERGYSMPSHEYRLTHGSRALRPLMIIPTLEKSILRHPYVGLLTKFSDALKEIDLLVAIGNSLRDDHLRNTIRERASGLEIILINPAARDQTAVLHRRESTHAVPLGIEEFIDDGLQSFHDLLSTLDGMEKAEARRTRIAEFAAVMSALVDSNKTMTSSDRERLKRVRSDAVDVVLQELHSLSESTHPAILSEVRSLALQNSDESVRIAAIDTLARARGIDAAEVLERIATVIGPLPVRAEALLALHSMDSVVAQEAYRRAASTVGNDQPMASIVTILREPTRPISAAN